MACVDMPWITDNVVLVRLTRDWDYKLGLYGMRSLSKGLVSVPRDSTSGGGGDCWRCTWRCSEDACSGWHGHSHGIFIGGST